MPVIHRITHGPLAELVEFMWLAEGYVQPHAAERVLPTGNMGLTIDLDPHGNAIPLLSGAATQSFVLDTSKPLSILGVGFKHGGGFPFVSAPPAELQDLSVPLDVLWGRQALTLREQLLEARTAAERFKIIETSLLEMSRRDVSRHPAVRYAIKAFRGGSRAPSIAAVTERTGLSARRFIELFRREVGLTPKVFCRVARFRDVVNGIRANAPVDWAQTALDCGYFDQAHFIHDFQAFAGMSPSDYLRHRTGSPNHVRLAG